MKKIYYGWFLLPFASLGVIMSIPGQTAGFSAFTEPLLGISGLSRTALSTAYLAGTISSGFILPFMGKIVDRFGARVMMTLASAGLAITLLLFSMIDSSVQAVQSLIPGIPLNVVFILSFIIGIFCLRFFGQGMLPLVANTMMGKWFEKHRGKAVAIMGVANSLAFASAPAVMNGLVKGFGWQEAWRILALVLGFGMAGIALLFYRKNPESCGLHVDGITPSGEQEIADSLQAEIQGKTLKEARQMPMFWIAGIVLAVHSTINTGFIFHINVIGTQAGISVEKAVSIFIPVSLISVPLSFASSWVSNKVKPHFYIMAMAFGEFIAYSCIFLLNSTAGYLGTIAGLGIAGGLMGPIVSTVIPKLFGRRHLGAINGAVSSMLVIGSSLGPLFLSAINDLTGSFMVGILISAILPVIIFTSALWHGKSQPPPA